MNLPKEINPNPIVISTVELRYKSEYTSQKLFPLVYDLFKQTLPLFEQISIPAELKEKNENFKYNPDYVLYNDNYRLSFSNCVLSFENQNAYQLWPNYSKFISESISKFFNINHIQVIDRVGVRYASVLDKTESVNQVLNFTPSINNINYEESFEQFSTKLSRGEMSLFLQIFQNAQSTKSGQKISGVYIDIDASQTGEFEANSKIFDLINALHDEEKKLFFSLLKPEFLNSLNPVY
jgi:uncharacterized protein (TIGR04255 family)